MMDIPRGERLTVKVDLLGEPCLWRWEIVDTADGTLIESSWATEWTAYESAREALRAGTMRLTELTRRTRGARARGALHNFTSRTNKLHGPG
jgi:hypothetical protein